ncbi:hypothetical protein [Paraburkholderia lycopersici]|uniref:Uncharacterized protein n=1 Tax=Paraburkholderia lycopersici TaxID=416944 RepID=A0A1G6PB24_9BURK|nr:hypothetical protein [Paraburkholderia lycopersici]SDC77343.1 hypothetical protein SAMN05421548_11085 [Paraburkholderia lycopersici]
MAKALQGGGPSFIVHRRPDFGLYTGRSIVLKRECRDVGNITITRNDYLIWRNTHNGSDGLDLTQLTQWESIALNDNSQLTFKNYSTLTPGDAGPGTGTLSIDSSSAAL